MKFCILIALVGFAHAQNDKKSAEASAKGGKCNEDGSCTEGLCCGFFTVEKEEISVKLVDFCDDKENPTELEEGAVFECNPLAEGDAFHLTLSAAAIMSAAYLLV